MTDGSGNVRARYAYDPYGHRTKLAGDLETDFGFAGMFWSAEANLSLTHFRAYDPELGRWLSRDPLRKAELNEGPNLYAYIRNNPVNLTDPLGLCCEKEADRIRRVFRAECHQKGSLPWECIAQADQLKEAIQEFIECVSKGCEPPACRKRPPNCSIPRLFFEITGPALSIGGILLDSALDDCVWIGGSK